MTTYFKDFSATGTKPEKVSELRSSGDSRRTYRDCYKRILDVVFVLLSAPVALPLIGFMALLTARDGATPFYRQARVGKNGRVFGMWKIRTMVPNAEERLESHLAASPQTREEWDSTQKLKNDPRITSTGKFLRKSSLDELPQLWNVLTGDMSLVGPRPMMENQESLYPGTAYYALRPGVTGSWQVSDRNETTFAGRAKFDTEYYYSLSLATDLKILARTVNVVLRATGH
ncbi:sugar transferase [Aliiroseovarius subalbicans]|uniref:sugar transferase n=1 Tax=Aliiroseovarius subalbicans TaxID=2925840 RepID=UPI001F5AA286|nr:sugar transferase [Aliiroseovarius subalbicans]MCI2401153.1 sugar transferase [Aliiroseovarius subalbicans]